MSNELNDKYLCLQSLIRGMESVVIGYSGGVDSTLLLKVAVDLLGVKALAVIGKSETYPTAEYEDAMRVARQLGAEVEVVRTEETDNLKFQENPANRCYFCKTELFSKLRAIADKRGMHWIADGTIVDDMGDFRPGLQAKTEQEVRSPLLEAGFTKADVRSLSQELNLPTWDKGSFACLSSRFPYGFGITKTNLTRVDRAESLLRELGFRHFRVRFHDEHTARIEVGQEEIGRLLQDDLRLNVVNHMKEIGFTYITLDLQGYRTGSMNEVLPERMKPNPVVKTAG